MQFCEDVGAVVDSRREPTSPEKSCDVVVIGGGLSGLCAADYLRKCKCDVLVCEARDRVGGRTLSKEIWPGIVSDLGGSYVGRGQNRILRIAQELGVKTFPVRRDGKEILHMGGRVFKYEDDLPPCSLLEKLDIHHMWRTLDALAATVPCQGQFPTEAEKRWDGVTVAEWIHKNGWTALGKAVITALFEVSMCVTASETSMLYFLEAVGSAEGMDHCSEGCQEFKFIGGSQQISQLLADRIGKDRILLNCPVNKVVYTPVIGDRQPEVTVTARDGMVVKAKYAIVALPPNLYGRIEFQPPLPAPRMWLTQAAPQGNVIKVLMVFKEAWWREGGMNGCIFCDVESGPLCVTNDDTQPHHDLPSLMGFIVAAQARFWMTKPQDQRRACVLDQLRRLFWPIWVPEPLVYTEQDWTAEEFSGGGYSTVFAPGVATQVAWNALEPMGNLLFACSDLSESYAGYMDGAVCSGEQAAFKVATQLQQRHVVDPSIPLLDPSFEPENADFPRLPEDAESLLDKMMPSVPTFLVMSSLIGVALIGATAAFLLPRFRKN